MVSTAQISILVEELLSGLVISFVGDLDGVMVENVVHIPILISTEVSGSCSFGKKLIFYYLWDKVGSGVPVPVHEDQYLIGK